MRFDRCRPLGDRSRSSAARLSSIAFTVALVGCSPSAGSDPAALTPSMQAIPTAGSSSEPANGIDDLAVEAVTDGASAVFLGVFGDGESTTVAAGTDGSGNPVTADQPWEAASISKMIVATTVLQLVDDGFIDLDDPVSDYVDFPMSERISVRDVMSHRSAIPSMQHQLESCPTEATIDEMKQLAGDAETPTEFADYSNTNYLLLGHLVRQVTGRDVGALAYERIFDPLGMRSTYWWESQEGPPAFAWTEPEISPDSCPRLERTVGTEGLTFVTSLSDLDEFFRGLFGGRLISDAALEQMLPSRSGDDGLGIWGESDRNRGVVLYGHPGSRSSLTTAAYYDPSSERSVIAFAGGGAEAEELAWSAWDRAEDEE